MTGRASAGFSLIELLIAVAVLSALAVGASLAGFGAGRAAPSDAEALVAAAETAGRRALLQRAPQALILGPEALRAAQATAGGWQPGAEIARWRQPPEATATGPALPAVLVFLPDGRMTPFSVAYWDGYRRILCQSDGWQAPDCSAR